MLVCASWTSPLDAACDRSSQSVSPQRLAVIKQGFNLTGWVDHSPGARPRRPPPELLRKLAELGFTHVRLPVRAELVIPVYSSKRQATDTFGELDNALKSLFDAGYAVSLDIHSDGHFVRAYTAEPEVGFAQLDALWKTITDRYARFDSNRLFFELLNEPGIQANVWRTHAVKLISTIRVTSPDRTIVYGPAKFSRYDELITGPDLGVGNIIYAVHFYDPMPFTHQGASWESGPNRLYGGIPFPTSDNDERIKRLAEELWASRHLEAANVLLETFKQPWTAARVHAEIAKIGQWMDRVKAPVIINEFGVLRWRAPAGDRLKWLAAVRRAAETHCIGWAHWEFADAFGFVDFRSGAVIDRGVVAALLSEHDSQ